MPYHVAGNRVQAYLPPWQRRPPPPPPRAEPPPPALPDGLLAAFADREFGSRGEWSVPSPSEGISWGPGLIIEPPDWPEEQRQWAERERQEHAEQEEEDEEG